MLCMTWKVWVSWCGTKSSNTTNWLSWNLSIFFFFFFCCCFVLFSIKVIPWRSTGPWLLQEFLSACACGLSLCLLKAAPHTAGSEWFHLAPSDLGKEENLRNSSIKLQFVSFLMLVSTSLSKNQKRETFLKFGVHCKCFNLDCKTCEELKSFDSMFFKRSVVTMLQLRYWSWRWYLKIIS